VDGDTMADLNIELDGVTSLAGITLIL